MGRAFEEKDGLISIVVPVYNAAAFLEETIAKVQAQSYENWELLLVDDCSRDESGAIAAAASRADGRVRPIRQERNQGAAAARNRGTDEAGGRYLCFLDADDIWEPDKLQAELDFMREKQAGFVFTGYEFADEQGRGLGRVVRVPETISYRQALKNTTIFTSTVMIDRARIPDEDIRMPDIASEDTATWWRILRKHGLGYGLNRNLVRYRRSANTLSSNKVTAIKRIWNLYRRQERLSMIKSLYCMAFWAFRAVARRV
ncbi:MAG: glycosyltransferase [Roseburia sp.]|nr:glycosyltransferase [Roseburia sp.]